MYCCTQIRPTIESYQAAPAVERNSIKMTTYFEKPTNLTNYVLIQNIRTINQIVFEAIKCASSVFICSIIFRNPLSKKCITYLMLSSFSMNIYFATLEFLICRLPSKFKKYSNYIKWIGPDLLFLPNMDKSFNLYLMERLHSIFFKIEIDEIVSTLSKIPKDFYNVLTNFFVSVISDIILFKDLYKLIEYYISPINVFKQSQLIEPILVPKEDTQKIIEFYMLGNKLGLDMLEFGKAIRTFRTFSGAIKGLYDFIEGDETPSSNYLYEFFTETDVDDSLLFYSANRLGENRSIEHTSLSTLLTDIDKNPCENESLLKKIGESLAIFSYLNKTYEEFEKNLVLINQGSSSETIAFTSHEKDLKDLSLNTQINSDTLALMLSSHGLKSDELILKIEQAYLQKSSSLKISGWIKNLF